MSAKLLMGLSEENPELEKQIGCMTGIFQVFDRHHFLTGRRLIGLSHKRLPSGQSRSSNNDCTEEHNTGSPRMVADCNRNKKSKENRRVAMESSATKPKSSYIETKHTRNDFRDVVKDSISAETRALTVKTSAKADVRKGNALKHIDSPRPIMSVDLNDSLCVLVRLKEAPYACEPPRFSCDGREISRSKSSTKLRELPRFSLDGREVKDVDRSSLNQGVHSVVAKLMGLDALPSSADGEKDRVPHSPKGSFGVSDTRKLKNAGSGSRHVSEQSESVYSQIERRVKELEFSQSNRDLRALKHVLDTMQAKGILEKKDIDDQQSKTSQKNQNMKSEDCHGQQVSTPRAFESPIVILKPAKSIKRPEDLEGLSGLRKLRTSDSAIRRKAKDQAPSSEKRIEERNSQRVRTPPMQRSPRPQQLARERSRGPAKTVSSSSPRVQQRKLELERTPQSPTRKHKSSRKPLEPVLPNGNTRLKPRQAQMDDTRRKQANEMSQREDVHISLATQANDEAMRDECSIITDSPSHRLDIHKIQNEDSSSTDSATISMEQPSPISVLDQAAFYQDDLPLSPVKKISCSIEDDGIQTRPYGCKITMSLIDTAPSKLSREIHLQKLSGIKNLVDKLTRLCCTDDTDDHDLVSQILLSAGLLSEESSPWAKSNAERLHQELMLDVVKETLARKLESMSKHGPRPNFSLRSKKLSNDYLTTELCSEIKQLLVKRPMSTSLEDDDMAFREDLLRQSDGWEDLGAEVPGLVLEIERSIFKDLIDEVVMGEDCSRLQVGANGRRRQLFT